MNKPCKTMEGPSPGRAAGFSLLELLIVVCIMLVVTTLYWSRNSPSVKERGLKSCRQNLEKIYVALEIYAHDNARKYPVTAGAQTSEDVLDVLVPRYASDTSVFTCPAGKTSPLRADESVRNGRISYAYYMGVRSGADGEQALMSDKQVDTRPKNKGDVIFSGTGSAPGNNHRKEGGNVLFCDGRVESSPARASFPLVSTPGVVLLNPKP